MAYTDDLEYENKCFYRDNKKLNTYLNNKIEKLEDMELRIMNNDNNTESRIKDMNYGQLLALRKIRDFIKNGYIELEE